jgi:signal transduction histidine kinase
MVSRPGRRPDQERQALLRQLESERALREKAEAASRAKSEFIAVLSHELRTPLQALVGYTDLLEGGVHGVLTPVQLEDVRRMQRSEQHLLRVLNSVLDFVKLDSGVSSEMEARHFSVPEVLRGLHTLIAPQLEAKQLAFVSRYADPPPTAWADPAYVQQIVLNLLSNAVKFTPSGGSVEVETADSVDGHVAIRVRDTGIGIGPDMLEAVFEPFVQARGQARAEARGTGLGLAISRRLAAGMGGSLSADSSPGAGSTFTLLLRRDEPGSEG